MSLPYVSIGALGGTISMQTSSTNIGISPSLTGEHLIASVPQLATLARIKVETIQLIPSASIDFELLLTVFKWARLQIQQGSCAVIITQGTDTLEESAFFLDLLWDLPQPLIIMGAMRSAQQVGADGSVNLLASVQTAINTHSQQRGVLVVMNDHIHEARHVRKSNTLAIDAFTSPIFGSAGLLLEGRPHYLRIASKRQTIPYPKARHRVAYLEATLGDDAGLLRHILQENYQGLVIAGFGVGHLSDDWAQHITLLTSKMPVIIGSRTGAGSTIKKTYNFSGSEIDLINKGCYTSYFLCPRKSRLLLWLIVNNGMNHQLEDYLQNYG